jgi:hypothetical protein
MNNIIPVSITFNQIDNNSYTLGNDKFNIAGHVMTPNRIEIAKSCPFNSTKENTAFYFINVDGVIGSRMQLFGTQFYAQGEVIPCGTGSSFETAEALRHTGIGADAMIYIATNKEYPVFLAAGLSHMALPLYQKLKFHILEYPRIMQLRNARPILQMKGLNGALLSCGSKVCNAFLKPFLSALDCKNRKLLKKFTITKETVVPKWVDDIVHEDGHKYMELHDRRWLQWNLDYNVRGLPQDIQSFYSVMLHGEHIGFFMTKERFREVAGGALKNVIIGSIVEWGSKDLTILSESDIYKIATTTFSNTVDIIETATSDETVVKAMKSNLFIRHGYAHIALKDKTKKFKDASDINLWRVRYGYADVILT